MNVTIAGEDPVCKAIARRLIDEKCAFLRPGLELPMRGRTLSETAQKLNEVGNNRPVLMIVDLDGEACLVDYKNNLLAQQTQSQLFGFLVCVDEAENWLLADREGLSAYLSVPISSIPDSCDIRLPGRTGREVPTPCKTSLFMMQEVAANSTDSEVRKGLSPKGLAKKGPLYNSILIPYIENYWDVDRACQRSASLTYAVNKAIQIDQLIGRHSNE